MPQRVRVPALLVLLAMLPLAACTYTPRPPAPWPPEGTAVHLMTKWGSEVTPDRTPLPEYPRPTLVRERWLNLNGLWDYHIAYPAGLDVTNNASEARGKILVPFPFESALSGVGKPLTGRETIVYSRTFELPGDWANHWSGQNILLHFGAVNWHCLVSLNGTPLGEHDGGYDPFSFDITGALKPGVNTLVVEATNPVNLGGQPRGKQWLSPHAIWYTASTGIWQTVWLEPVPAGRIERITATPDIHTGEVVFDVSAVASTRAPLGPCRIDVLRGGKVVASCEDSASRTLRCHIAEPSLWSPDAPNLYTIRATFGADAVESYFAFREISVVRDATGLPHLALNGRVLFQYGPLDQGFWPDGLYTAPTDDALRFDIEAAKRMGCNMIRKHVKVEPGRWYTWCDRLGVLVWQDMPSAFFKTRDTDAGDPVPPEFDERWRANFERELDAMIAARRFHPCIVVWVPFNEGWGQNDLDWSRRVARHVKQLDPTRLVNCATGWTDTGVGDTRDIHAYPDPALPPVELAPPHRAAVLGEFGGLGLPVEGHTWVASNNWGYRTYKSPGEVTAAYLALLDQMPPLIAQGLCAAVYTQTTDVEIECNGWLTYDRAMWKIDPEPARAATMKLYAPAPEIRTILPRAREGVQAAQRWRLTTTKPAAADWFAPTFDDSRWIQAPAGFGSRGTPGAIVGTEWTTDDIYLRTTFTLDAVPAHPMLNIHHDEDAEVYLNGVLAATLKGYTTSYHLARIAPEAAANLHAGPNTLAIHCHQTTGGQYIDCGVVDVLPTK